MKTGPPDESELKTGISNLKDGKSANDLPTAYIKHELCSKEILTEMIKLYETIWITKMIPKRWGDSKLVMIWKGPEKGKADDPKTYRGL